MFVLIMFRCVSSSFWNFGTTFGWTFKFPRTMIPGIMIAVIIVSSKTLRLLFGLWTFGTNVWHQVFVFRMQVSPKMISTMIKTKIKFWGANKQKLTFLQKISCNQTSNSNISPHDELPWDDCKHHLAWQSSCHRFEFYVDHSWWNKFHWCISKI